MGRGPRPEPEQQASVRLPGLERVQAYLVPDTDVLVMTIVDDSHELIDVVEVETLPAPRTGIGRSASMTP